ncbi:ion transporter [Sinisalibacter aestuarii]|uniref:Ion transport domain-containing protein n=1 Tax=Sinisalibacter aestuarii TaxID=2949426 RepID=A0ABQ5LR19_9RHOB|nr:ion transporter [Sinisalibacter aestuarii]GKY87455.1 hypothetical protein STA1M1_13240 [Sinisalibacter aestuarii]
MKRHEIIALLDGDHERHGNKVGLAIDTLIVLSAISIALETEPSLPAALRTWLRGFEIFVLAVFSLEYIVRVWASPKPLRYIFSIWGVIDLMSILPAIAFLNPHWQALRALRLVRLLKLFRTSRSLERLATALGNVRGELMVFGAIWALMLYVGAVGIFLFEHDAQPEAFSSIMTSLWWAVASFTTVGYGDMVPITTGGRIFTTLVLFIGLGIIAVPAAIVTTALLEAAPGPRRHPDAPHPKPDETNNGE